MREALAKRDAGSIVSNVISLSLMLAAEASHASTYITQRARYLRREGLPTSLHLPQPAPMGLAGESARSPLERQLLDITRLSLPTLLRYEDRNSAGNGLESRLPYLDYRFVEFSAALPARLKVHNGYGKWALRQLMRGRIPSAIRAARYKRAFDAPRRSWVAAGLGRAIRERLTEERAIAASWLSSDTDVAELFSDARLTSDPTAFVEASSLLWLIQHAN
jgi:asparagine synthase (glutamine-hydrolysing)